MHDEENSPMRGRKRKSGVLSPGISKFDTDSDQGDSAASSLSSRSFYGSSKKKYVTPLERREIHNIRGEDSDLNSSSSISSPQQSRRNNLLGKLKSSSKPSPKASLKPSLKLSNSKKSSSKSNIEVKENAKGSRPAASNFDTRHEENANEEMPKKNASDSTGPTKKFFRNSSPGKRARRAGTTLRISKGMNFKYKPSGVAKRPRSPRKKLLVSDKKFNTKVQTPVKAISTQVPAKPQTPTRSSQRLQTDTPNKAESSLKKAQMSHPRLPSRNTSTPRRSPRKRTSSQKSQNENHVDARDSLQDLFASDGEDVDSGVGKQTQDYELKLFESPAKSTPANSSLRDELSSSPDSVMLISEIGSESTPQSSKSSKKLFSIFDKGSPSARSSPRRKSANNSPLSTPGSSKRSSHTRANLLKKATHGKEQMMLDFGQKRIGATQCQACGMTYSVAEPVDEATHTKFHERMLNMLKFPGWKRERVVQEMADGSRVVMVLPEDKYAAKKVEQIKKIVDEDLGFVVDGRKLRDAKTFLYISENKVVGCCVAQVIRQAYRVLSEEQAARSQDSTSVHGRPWCCSSEPEKARAGISRIWVLASHRRKNIATQLLDCVRYSFMMGCPLAIEDLAFSDPTPAGMGFATHYTGTPTFLVYKNVT